MIVGGFPLNPEDPEGEQITFILIYKITDSTLTLVDIGQHDDIYAAYRS